MPEASQLIDRLLLENTDEDDDFDVESELQQIVEPKTKPGELIELGPHRILCGDCTDIANIKQLMEDKKAQLVYNDPPIQLITAAEELARTGNINYARTVNNTGTRCLSPAIKTC